MHPASPAPHASGEGQESDELDRETKKYIYTNVEDLKRAQVRTYLIYIIALFKGIFGIIQGRIILFIIHGESYLIPLSFVFHPQMEVFGHRLQPGEFERMDPHTQKKNSDQMMALIQKWREDRRARDLRR